MIRTPSLTWKFQQVRYGTFPIWHSQKAHSKKGISHASHHFHSQGVTSFFSIQVILSLHFLTGEMKKEKKKKSEERKVKTKKPQLASSASVAAITSVLSAVPLGMKDGRQCSARLNSQHQYLQQQQRMKEKQSARVRKKPWAMSF